MSVRRRTILTGATAVAGAAAGLVAGGPGAAQAVDDVYGTNTELYRDPALTEGVDYGRRYRRHAVLDDDLAQRLPVPKTTVIAVHGGGIEPGTSELCLAVAGYHPATLEVAPAGAVPYDYWMFEGLRAANNDALHVTSTHCDDGVAVALCAGVLNVLSLHGCTTAAAGLPVGTRAVLVGGRNEALKQRLLAAIGAAGIQAIDAAGHGSINGDDRLNIANRTLLGMGGHLELTTPLREAMFEINTRPRRRHTTTEVFWAFVAACREALAATEATQPIL
jgi:phage replication-related protein YjqB (UPF0714/DUF867 family)